MANNHDSQAEYSLYISNLIHRLQEGEPLSEQEQKHLDEWRQPAGREAVFQELMDRKRFISDVRRMNDFDGDVAVDTIFGRLGLAPVRKLVPMRRWAAVAAAILVVGVSVWLLLPKRSEQRDEAATQKVIVPAGGNKAILTLASGAQVVLDTTKTGTIARQGSTNVIKMADGRLAYEPGEHVTAITYNTLSTPRGGQYQLTLPDGSRVWLNAASSVTYPTAFTGSNRSVKITGEAYLEIQHSTRPFFVEVGGQQIEVLGTSFNVNAYADEPVVRTTLIEGKVKVKSAATERALDPRWQAVNKGGAIDLKALNDVEVDAVLAWKNGAFSFNSADLPTVMRQLARWYDIEVEYPEGVPGGTFDGEIGRGLTLNQVLEGLSKTRINYTIVNAHKIIVRP